MVEHPEQYQQKGKYGENLNNGFKQQAVCSHKKYCGDWSSKFSLVDIAEGSSCSLSNNSYSGLGLTDSVAITKVVFVKAGLLLRPGAGFAQEGE